jgi:hypothetical protein
VSRWTRSLDGVVRTDLDIRFRLGVEELAKLLTFALEDRGDDGDQDVERLSGARVREIIRGELRLYGLLGNRSDGEPDDAHRAAVRRAFAAPA